MLPVFGGGPKSADAMAAAATEQQNDRDTESERSSEEKSDEKPGSAEKPTPKPEPAGEESPKKPVRQLSFGNESVSEVDVSSTDSSVYVVV